MKDVATSVCSCPKDCCSASPTVATSASLNVAFVNSGSFFMNGKNGKAIRWITVGPCALAGCVTADVGVTLPMIYTPLTFVFPNSLCQLIL